MISPLKTVMISTKTQPRDHISEDEFRFSPAPTFGAQYLLVLGVSPDVVLLDSSAKSRDIPESVSRALPSSTKTFCGFISLWRTPESCKYASAADRHPWKLRRRDLLSVEPGTRRKNSARLQSATGDRIRARCIG